MSPVSANTEPAQEPEIHRLLLFVCDGEPNSVRARENLDRICATRLRGRCDVRVIDVLKDYRAALEHNVLVTPCLVKLEPRPRALIAGTLSDADAVHTALQLPEPDRDD